MKIPRDINAKELVKKLEKFGYASSRQTGSHIRLTRVTQEGHHHVTIPNHNPIKVGTLNNILRDVAAHFGISKEELTEKLFV